MNSNNFGKLYIKLNDKWQDNFDMIPMVITAVSSEARGTRTSPPACRRTGPAQGPVYGAGGGADPGPCLWRTLSWSALFCILSWPLATLPATPCWGPHPGQLLDIGDPLPELGAQAEAEEADQPSGHHTKTRSRQADS